MPRAASTAAASASSSCTSPIRSAASGSRSAWKSEQQEPIDRSRILDQLVRADVFEQTIHSRYIGTKRYSLEGNTALIPLLDEILNSASGYGAEQAVLAMSHRGRLNVIINIVSRPAAEIFAGFEDVDPRSVLGGGDVKYHIGATGMYTGASGRPVRIHLVSNPSHLEAVDPVALGRARAKQTRLGRDGKAKVLPDPDAWRLRVRRAGNYRRDAEPRQPARLYRRRNGSHHRQQSDRLHHQSQRRLFRPVLVRSRQAPADSDLPRQRRRCRRRGARRPHGAGIRYEFGSDVGGRSHRLPPARTFRSRRSDHHAAHPVSQDQRPSHCSTRSTPRTSAWIRSLTSRSSRRSWTPRRRPARAWSRSRSCGSCPAIGRRIMAALTTRRTKSIPDCRPSSCTRSPMGW